MLPGDDGLAGPLGRGGRRRGAGAGWGAAPGAEELLADVLGSSGIGGAIGSDSTFTTLGPTAGPAEGTGGVGVA